MAGRQRCTDHGVTDCIVCFPHVPLKFLGDMQKTPDFPNAGEIMETPKEKMIESINPPDRPSPSDPPLIAAAIRLTKAGEEHIQAQKDVARMKEQLISAEKHLESTYILKINAQEEMSKILEESK